MCQDFPEADPLEEHLTPQQLIAKLPKYFPELTKEKYEASIAREIVRLNK